MWRRQVVKQVEDIGLKNKIPLTDQSGAMLLINFIGS